MNVERDWRPDMAAHSFGNFFDSGQTNIRCIIFHP